WSLLWKRSGGELGIPGGVGPVIAEIRAARNDSADLVNDHFEGLALGGIEKFPSAMFVHRVFQGLGYHGVLRKVTVGLAAFSQKRSCFYGHSSLLIVLVRMRSDFQAPWSPA